MKKSQIALLSVAGTLGAIIIVSTGVFRVALSQVDPEPPGDPVTRSLDLEGFRGIAVEGAWRVTVTQGDEWQVEVTHPSNREIDAYVDGDLLRLDRRGSFGWPWRTRNTRVSAEIVMPELEDLHLAGASRLEVSGFEGERLEMEIAGAVEIVGRDGRYEELELSIAGASEVDLRELVVVDAELDLAGASEVVLAMDGGVLSGSLAGAGSVDYYGTVAEEEVRIAGAARIRHVD